MAQMDLLLLCHGKAKTAKPQDGGAPELTSRAKRQAQKLGAWMQAHALRPERTVSTPSTCARTSAEKALKAGGWSAQDIQTDARLDAVPSPEALPDTLALLGARSMHRLLWAGHPKILSAILAALVPDSPRLAPGTLTRLRCHADGVHKGTAELVDLVAADDLPDGFLFPGPGGTERRDRPPYNYTQSAALPYRLRDGVPEILLITSSSGRKWGIPKGICEPGLSPQESAAQEALEEAGLTGRMHPSCLRAYDLPKWGAVCRVSVYAMEVTGVLDDAAWDEHHRQRIWLSPAAAAARVTSPDLAQIIHDFDIS